MYRYSFLFVAALSLAACGTSKEAASPKPAKGKKEASAADYPLIQKFHEGVRLKQKGQFGEAITAFQQVLAMDPAHDAAAFALAQCYLQTNQRSQAVVFTEKAAKLDPENIWYAQELAYMYFEEGKLDQSEAAFQKIIAKQPQNIDWLFGYAEVLRREGKTQEAINAFNRMEEQLGILPDLSIQKYDLYMSLKQEQKALQELDKARKDYPNEPALIGMLVDHYFKKNDIPKAKAMLEELVRTNPENGRAHLALGDIYMRENDKTKAYFHFREAFKSPAVDIETQMAVLKSLYESSPAVDPEVAELADLMVAQHPADALAYSVQGDLLLKAGKDKEALESYRNALKYDESKYAIWNQVLLMEYRLQLFDELYKDARACSALFPTITNVQLLYVIACNQTGRFQEAADAADAGKEIVVNDKVAEGEFYAQKGEAEFKLNNVPGGVANFETALKLDPDNAITKSNYAMMLAYAKSDLKKAGSLIDEVMLKYPNEAPYIDTKGFILFQSEDYKAAKTEFEAAHILAPQVAAYTEHLGDAYFKTGSAVKALELWNEAKKQGSKNKSLDKKIQTKTYHAPVY